MSTHVCMPVPRVPEVAIVCEPHRRSGLVLMVAMLWAALVPAQVPAAERLSFTLHYIDRDADWATSAMQMSLSDLNGDGKLDWTVGNCYDTPKPGDQRNFYWYEYQKPDTWVKHTIIEGSAGATTAATASLDVNGDGHRDLISGRYLFLNNGNGASWTKYDIGTSTSANQAHDHQATDINGDGKLDILSTNWWKSAGPSIGIYWYEAPSDPTKSWRPHKITSGVPPGYKAVHGATYPDATGDFDGDGDTDVVGALGWFENKDSAGTKWEEHWNPGVFLGVDGTYQTAVRNAVRDLNGDGFPDIVQSECDTKTPVKLAWLKNDGRGNFTRNIIREGFKEDYHSLAVADFDNDGDLDVFTGSGPLSSGQASHNMYLFENTAGPGRDPVFIMHNIAEFLSPEDARKLAGAFSSDHCHEPMFGDVNGDGTIDLVVKGWDGRDMDGQPQKPAPFMFLENTTGKVRTGRTGSRTEGLLPRG